MIILMWYVDVISRRRMRKNALRQLPRDLMQIRRDQSEVTGYELMPDKSFVDTKDGDLMHEAGGADACNNARANGVL